MVTILQEVKNWLLRKHHAHTLKLKRKHSQMKLTSFYLFELFNSFSISARYNKHMVSASRLRWCSTERPGSRICVAFLRVVMFRLFAFAFTFARISRRRESSSSISSRYRFFSIISRQSSGFISSSRELVERTKCQQVQSWGIHNSLWLWLGLQETAHKSLANHRAYLSLSHFPHNAILWIWWLILLLCLAAEG